MFRRHFTRRSFLTSAGAAAAAGCHQKPTGYNGYAFVACRDDKSIAVVDLMRFRRLRAIALPAGPSQVATLPPLEKPVAASVKVFVLAPDAGSVYEIDAGSLAVARQAQIGGQPVAMALGPDNAALWVLGRNPNELVEIRLDSMTPGRRVALPAECQSFDMSSAGQVAASSGGAEVVYVASLRTGMLERAIAVKEPPSFVCFERDGKQLMVGSHAGRNLSMFDAATGRTTVRLPLGLAPRNFCTNSDGGQIYVTGDGMDAVAIVYPYQTEVAETILAGHAPGPMTTAGGVLLVANPDDARVTALDVNGFGNKLLTVIDVGQGPRRLITSPDERWVFALNEQSADMAVIRVSSLSQRRSHLQPSSVFTMAPVGASPVDVAILSRG